MKESSSPSWSKTLCGWTNTVTEETGIQPRRSYGSWSWSHQCVSKGVLHPHDVRDSVDGPTHWVGRLVLSPVEVMTHRPEAIMVCCDRCGVIGDRRRMLEAKGMLRYVEQASSCGRVWTNACAYHIYKVACKKYEQQECRKSQVCLMIKKERKRNLEGETAH